MKDVRRITVVAEAAQGFEGKVHQARLLARAAARGGADLVKFQLVYADELALPGYRWYDLFRTLEMSDKDWRSVREEASKAGIGLVFDVFGPRSLELAIALSANAIKVHATDFFNDELVRGVLRSGLDVHLSLGGITSDELGSFLTRHAADGAARIVLLTGYQAEPTPVELNNLARLASLKREFPNQRLGWMDHADGDADEAGWLGVLAVPYGISVLEKHITLARPLELEDGISALDPSAFKSYVQRIRIAERAIGDPTLELTEAERAYRRRALKSVIATRSVAAGTVIAADFLVLKRSAVEDQRVPFQMLENVVGRKALRPIAAGDVICEGDVG